MRLLLCIMFLLNYAQDQVSAEDATWSQWSKWKECGGVCDNGRSVRTRICLNQNFTEVEGCEGRNKHMKRCFLPCPVDGMWSEWTDWSPCSASCNTGEMVRTRRCDRPAPQFGGRSCNSTEAGEVQFQSCALNPCPVDGEWSDWGTWGDCYTTSCEDRKRPAQQMRVRACDSPTPEHKGSMCQGPFLQVGICMDAGNCEVDGGWSEWSEWTCKHQQQYMFRNRTCDSPTPSARGRPCTGNRAETLQKDDDLEEYNENCSNLPEDEKDDLASGDGIDN